MSLCPRHATILSVYEHTRHHFAGGPPPPDFGEPRPPGFIPPTPGELLRRHRRLMKRYLAPPAFAQWEATMLIAPRYRQELQQV